MVFEKAKDYIENTNTKENSMEVPDNFFDAEEQRCLLLKELINEKVEKSQELKLNNLKVKHDAELKQLYDNIAKQIQEMHDKHKSEKEAIRQVIEPKYLAIIKQCDDWLINYKNQKENEINGNMAKN